MAIVPRVRACLLVVVLSYCRGASAEVRPQGASFAPAFSIAKSENKNQVQYVVRVDEHCAPLGPAPVSAYWRMLEGGPAQTAPILGREVRAYGLASQAIVASGPSGGQVHATLNALPARPMAIETSRAADGACRAVVTTTIAGVPAHLFNVYVHIRWYGVDYLLLQGWSMDGSHVVRETVSK
jgi:hypothetical protein